MKIAIKKLGQGTIIMLMCIIEMISSVMEVIGNIFEILGCLFYELSDLLVKLEHMVGRCPARWTNGKYIKKDTVV